MSVLPAAPAVTPDVGPLQGMWLFRPCHLLWGVGCR